MHLHFNQDWSLDLKVDPGVELDSNMHVYVEMDLANATPSARKRSEMHTKIQ